MNPFQTPTTGQVPAPVAGFAPKSYGNAELPGGQSKPKPQEGHKYKVRVDAWLRNRGNTIMEYTVLENDGGGSPAGFTSSVVISDKLHNPEGQAALVALANLGVDVHEPSQVANARPVLDACMQEAFTKVPNPALPIHMVGRRIYVGIYAGNPPAPGRKYYPREDFSPCNE